MISGFLHHVSLEQPVLLVSSLVPMISVMTEISSLASLFPGFHIDVQSKLGGGEVPPSSIPLFLPLQTGVLLMLKLRR